MTLALFFLGWFAISLLLGAAWAATSSTRRVAIDARHPLAPAQVERLSDRSTFRSDAVAS